jgi:hypothetical protein
MIIKKLFWHLKGMVEIALLGVIIAILEALKWLQRR